MSAGVMHIGPIKVTKLGDGSIIAEKGGQIHKYKSLDALMAAVAHASKPGAKPAKKKAAKKASKPRRTKATKAAPKTKKPAKRRVKKACGARGHQPGCRCAICQNIRAAKGSKKTTKRAAKKRPTKRRRSSPQSPIMHFTREPGPFLGEGHRTAYGPFPWEGKRVRGRRPRKVRAPRPSNLRGGQHGPW